jgi:hypothetical protein
MSNLELVAYIAQERAATEAAIAKEYADVMVLMREASGEPPYTFTAEHVRLLVRSSFLAGVNHQLARDKAEGRR